LLTCNVEMSLRAAALAASLVALPIAATDDGASTAVARTQTLAIQTAARLLVISPHPDDEVIAAGGLIQRVRAAHGDVRVVYVTDGESYQAGVKIDEHVADPKSSDYREYGVLRQREARAALETLGVERGALTFLGFPNDGLSRLMTTYWSERRTAFMSPYTRRDRPPPSEIVVPATRYRGEDLTQELAAVIGSFHPTMIAVPRKEDQHADHCAAWYFTADALGDVRRVESDFRADVLNYIVHFNSWPFEDESDLLPPPDLPAGPSGWLNLPLTAAEAARKRRALQTYESQMRMMDWFLMAFARRNELFSRPPAFRVVLPVKRNPCAAFAEPGPQRAK
jgi:LmbE family N-acetylglucosaminyl deacetylase